jgi:hypothetical protein
MIKNGSKIEKNPKMAKSRYDDLEFL